MIVVPLSRFERRRRVESGRRVGKLNALGAEEGGHPMELTSKQDNHDKRQSSTGEAARKMYADFGQGDIEAVLDNFHADIEWHEAEGNPYQPDGTPFRGAQEIVEKLFARLGEEWDSFAVSPKAFHESNDRDVVVEGRYSGTFRGTGRQLDCQFCHVLSYQDGKLRSFQQYTDTDQLRSVMGA